MNDFRGHHCFRQAWQIAGAAMIALSLLSGCASTGQSSGGGDLKTDSDEGDAAKKGRIRMELATAYFSQGQFVTALDEVKQAINFIPNSSGAYNLRGLIYAAMAEDKLAEESFRKAMQLDPNDGGSKHNYAWFLCQRGRFDEADRQFNTTLALPKYRDVTQTLLAQGVCQGRAGRLTEADATLSKAYEGAPGVPAVVMNLADILFKRGEYERARFYIRRINNTPELVGPESLWLAARIEQKLGNQSGADEMGRRIRMKFPNSREALLYERGIFND